MDNVIVRLRKLLFCATHPTTWRPLVRCIAPSTEHIEALRFFSFDTVLDVGSNRGQFALLSKYLWPDAKIYCFEPLQKARDEMLGVFLQGSVEVFPFALGDENKNSTMYVTQQDDSSSLLAVGANQEKIFGTMLEGIVTNVAVKRLDSVFNTADLFGSSLLKIDVQGTELQVLRGAGDVLKSISAIYVECSYQELYVGQALASNVVAYLVDRGFRLHGVFNQITNKSMGAVQADILFLREHMK